MPCSHFCISCTGHVHSYERTNPVKNYQADPTGCAPTYVTIGDGGNSEKVCLIAPALPHLLTACTVVALLAAAASAALTQPARCPVCAVDMA